jgi:hypothetical protein
LTTFASYPGNATAVPDELKRWSWPAFFLNWIWGLGNRCYSSLLVFVPLFGLLVPFVLGWKGNAWAWRNGQWESVERFQQNQKRWARWAIIVYAATATAGIGLVSMLLITLQRSEPAQLARARILADPQVQQQLGTPIETGTALGSIALSLGGSGRSDLSFSVSGPKAKARRSSSRSASSAAGSCNASSSHS